MDGNYIEYERRGDNDDNLTLEEHLNIIRPHLRDMIYNHKAHSEWKKLVMKINFICSVGTNEFREMYTKSDNMKIKNGAETSDVLMKFLSHFLEDIKRIRNKNETKQFYI